MSKKSKVIPSQRLSIDEIQALLNSEEDEAIEILPNGEVRKLGSGTIDKPLTMRENLGGEYATMFY